MSIEFFNHEHVEQRLLHWRQVSRDFAALFERYGAPAPALRHFGLIQWQAQHHGVAVEALTAAISITPADPLLWSDLAGVYDAWARPDLAEFCIRGSIDRNPSQPTAWLQLASLQDRRGHREGAETAYRQALALDPTLAAAHFGLGILNFAQLRLDESVASLQAALRLGFAAAPCLACLGHVLYLTGDFGGAATAFEIAARSGPLDTAARRKRARAATLQAMIEGRIEVALAEYPALAGDVAEDVAEVARDAFSLLSAHGHVAQASKLGSLRLAANPGDRAQRYLLDAVDGRPLTQAPLDYVEAYFDGFAEAFDRKLVEVLRYRAPAQMAAMVRRHRAEFADILDLGCGTGLAADALAGFGGRLIGVDLSAAMLARAAQRGRYADLVKAEAVDFADRHPGGFDLVFAADVIIYQGDLSALVAATAATLRPGGLFALSIETTAAGDFVLRTSGRFAHTVGYLGRLTEPCFETLETSHGTLRMEANRPIEGALMVLRRR